VPVRVVIRWSAGGLQLDGHRLEVDTVALGYAIRDEGTAAATITCLACGRTSANPHDVDNRYCGACHIFLDVE
jgi:ribosomal protein S27AE